MESGETSEGNDRTCVKEEEWNFIRAGDVHEASLLVVLACY